MSVTKIYSDQSRQVNWTVRKQTDATLTVTVTQSSAAVDLTPYTFIAEFFEIRSPLGSPILTLTQDSGLTNGGASGILTISLTDTNLNLTADDYFWKLRTTAPTDYLWFNGIFKVNDYTWDGGSDYNVEVELTVANNNINLTIVAAAVSGGGSGDVVGPASSVDNEVVLFSGTTGKLIKSSSKVLTTIGGNVLALANPDAVSFLRGNADNSVTARSRADFLNDIFLLIANTQTDDYTLVLSDQNLVVDMNKATAITLTVPPNSGVNFPIGTFIYIRRIGVGTLTIAQGSGVTVTGSSGALTDPGQNVMMTLRKTGTNTWDLQNGVPGAWTDWTPTFTGFSSNPTGFTARYILYGKMCSVYYDGATSGTSNATTFTMTLPFAMANTGRVFGIAVVVDNSSVQTTPGRVRTAANSNILTVDKTTGAAGGFTASGGKNAFFFLTYEIA